MKFQAFAAMWKTVFTTPGIAAVRPAALRLAPAAAAPAAEKAKPLAKPFRPKRIKLS